MDTGVDPESWALIPAGEFLKGQFNHSATIDYDYEMMVTPVTNAQFADYLNEALAAGTAVGGAFRGAARPHRSPG